MPYSGRPSSAFLRSSDWRPAVVSLGHYVDQLAGAAWQWRNERPAGADGRRGGCREQEVALVSGQGARGEEGGHGDGRAAISAGRAGARR